MQYYDKEEWQKKLLSYTSEQLLEHLDIIKVNWVRPNESPEANKGKEVRVLDYACGPGTVSGVRITLLPSHPTYPSNIPSLHTPFH